LRGIRVFSLLSFIESNLQNQANRREKRIIHQTHIVKAMIKKQITENKKQKIEELLSRAIDQIYPSKEALREALLSGKKLRVYFGVDPTAPSLHLDHGTSLFILKRFQDLGHEVIFLVGDFTAQIGDPSGKISPRRQLSKKEIEFNIRNYKKQAGKILDFTSHRNPAKIVFNGSWWKKMSFEDFLGIMAKFTVSKLQVRDMFQERIKQGKEIYLHEFIYPLLQGYDSVALRADIELGGSDQTFNMLIGRDLCRLYLNREKFVITKKLLEDPRTGKILMSKSEGRYIALDTSAKDMYGKIMALPDEVIIPCFEHWTNINLNEIRILEDKLKKKEINPMAVKARLAYEVTAFYCGKLEAKKAAQEFKQVFSKKELPSLIPIMSFPRRPILLPDLLVKTKLASSKSEARRLIAQKGVKINGKTVGNWQETVLPKGGMVIQVGKRRFVKIR